MRIIRHVIFAICFCLAITAAFVIGVDYVKDKWDQTTCILFSAFCVLTTLGILTLLATCFLKAIVDVLETLFFGFFTGITLTNIVSEILSGTTYDSIVGYLTSYGLMVALLILCVTASCLTHVHSKKNYSTGEQIRLSGDEKIEKSTPTAAGQ